MKLHMNKSNENYSSIDSFVKNLKKKTELIYLDEFQVTNIVDAMILGRLFESIFKQNIKVLIFLINYTLCNSVVVS